jgi:predicted adenine nucleotide alpha hydrolase (AANH) superfamily ATPase
LLVHICCAVDSHYFLEKIKEEFPKEELVGFDLKTIL